MKMDVLAYKDTKLNIFTAPFYMEHRSKEDIIEITRRAAGDDKFPVEYFKYDLYLLGTFDDKLGMFDIISSPDFIVSIGDFKHLREEGVSENA